MKIIEIADEINELHLAIQEKIALETMRKRPGINNGALAKLLGLSNSGVRTMILQKGQLDAAKAHKFIDLE